ncbi:MAG: hypothetical protein ACNA7G_10665 [Methylobacter sp.]
MNSSAKKILLIVFVSLLTACVHYPRQPVYYPAPAYRGGYIIEQRNYYGPSPRYYERRYLAPRPNRYERGYLDPRPSRHEKNYRPNLPSHRPYKNEARPRWQNHAPKLRPQHRQHRR